MTLEFSFWNKAGQCKLSTNNEVPQGFGLKTCWNWLLYTPWHQDDPVTYHSSTSQKRRGKGGWDPDPPQELL